MPGHTPDGSGWPGPFSVHPALFSTDSPREKSSWPSLALRYHLPSARGRQRAPTSPEKVTNFSQTSVAASYIPSFPSSQQAWVQDSHPNSKDEKKLGLRRCQSLPETTGLRPLCASPLEAFPLYLSFFFLFFFKFYILIYLWLCWVFVAARGLSLVAASGGYSSLRCTGFSLQWLLLVQSTGSRHVGFSSCGSRAQ